jgi:hypothetical protein
VQISRRRRGPWPLGARQAPPAPGSLPGSSGQPPPPWRLSRSGLWERRARAPRSRRRWPARARRHRLRPRRPPARPLSTTPLSTRAVLWPSCSLIHNACGATGLRTSRTPLPVPAARGVGSVSQLNRAATSDNPRYIAANRVCQPVLPYGGNPPPVSAKQLTEEVKFAACIRQHGFTGFPDPDGQGVFVLHNFDLSSPRFQSAQKACRSIANLSGPMRINASNSGPTAPASH